MNNLALKNDYICKYMSVGQPRFYRFLLFCAINKLIIIDKGEYKGISPEIEFLNASENFLFLYRRNSETIYLELSKLFRKAAHRIYRLMLKHDMTDKNNRFLNLV